MSGPIVQCIGGPLDGVERHLVTHKRYQEQLFEAGDWSQPGPKEVHVYRSRDGTLPLLYWGTRPWKPNVDVVASLRNVMGGPR